MLFQTSEGPIRIYFYHTNTLEGERATLCRIKMRSDVPSSWGLAVCSKSDRFCKETGRKVALGRAILGLHLGNGWPITRTLRREIWNSYFSRRNSK